MAFYRRKGNTIAEYENNNIVNSNQYKSINKAKKESRKLQLSGNKVTVIPHKQTTKHIPSKQPFNH